MDESASELKLVTIYTDGGCIGNPGPGGYGVVLIFQQKRKEISAGFRLTTNNRMEMLAAIVGLETLKFRCRVTIYTDSKYLADSITRGSALRWKANGWSLSPQKPAKNPDLWEGLLNLCDQHEVQFEWVKGHAGNPENERCDRLSMRAAEGHDLPADDAYEKALSEQKEIAAAQDLFAAQDDGPDQPCSRRAPMTAITEEGQLCRKCQTPVVKKTPRQRPRPGQEFCFEYYLYCPGCGTMYMVEAAKRPLSPALP